jgi:hypothetical protein
MGNAMHAIPTAIPFTIKMTLSDAQIVDREIDKD